jgi:hypothetical protein
MKIVRFFDTAEGGSCFEQIELGFPHPRPDEFGNILKLTGAMTPADAVLAELPAGLEQDWHRAPNRQIVMVLCGSLEVETTDGKTQRWGPGGLFMADDTQGKGHRTRVIEGPARLVFMRMAADFALTDWVAAHARP